MELALLHCSWRRESFEYTAYSAQYCISSQLAMPCHAMPSLSFLYLFPKTSIDKTSAFFSDYVDKSQDLYDAAS